MRAAWLACAVVVVAPRVARADEPPPNEPAPEPMGEPAPPPVDDHPEDRPVLRPPRVREITVDIPGERSLNNKLMLAATAGAGLLAGGLGLYFHLDSRSAANEVSATVFTGVAWTPADQAQVDRADRSKTRAIFAYTLGGALVTAAIVELIVTEPKSEHRVIHPEASVAVSASGAMVGGTWRF